MTTTRQANFNMLIRARARGVPETKIRQIEEQLAKSWGVPISELWSDMKPGPTTYTAGFRNRPGGIVGRVMEKHGMTEERAMQAIKDFGG